MAATSSWLPGPPPGVDECRRRNLPSIFIVPLIMIIWKIQRYIYHVLSSTSSFPQHPRISKESKGNHGRIMYNNYIYIYIYIIYILDVYIIDSITFPVFFPPKTINEGSCWPSRSLWSKQNAKVSALALSWNQGYRDGLWSSIKVRWVRFRLF